MFKTNHIKFKGVRFFIKYKFDLIFTISIKLIFLLFSDKMMKFNMGIAVASDKKAADSHSDPKLNLLLVW